MTLFNICLVLTGGPRVFAAGADIKGMAERTPTGMVETRSFANWERIRRCRKPIVATVSGYALGGGCELAMLCDLIVASETAQFGQPEINIGIMPGAGGRYARLYRKATAEVQRQVVHVDASAKDVLGFREKRKPPFRETEASGGTEHQ